MRTVKTLAIIIGAFFIVGVVQSGTAAAATFVVDTTGDTTDSTPGDDICDDGGGDCSLRAALEEANADTGSDTINFSIPGAGPHTISPATKLPVIEHTVILDALTEPGSSCGTLVPSLPAASNTPHVLMITIDGVLYNNSGGLIDFSSGTGTGNASGSVVRGFTITGADNFRYGLVIGPYNNSIANNLEIECNNFTGNDTGMYATWTSNPTNRSEVHNNLFSGNAQIGFLGDANFHHNLVGTSANGLTAAPNEQGAESINGNFHHNIFSGNTTHGFLSRSGGDSTIYANFFGLNLAGEPLGNGGSGVYVYSQNSGFELGGDTAGERNYISANGGDGIFVRSEDYNADGCGAGQVSGGVISGNYIGTNLSGNIESGYGNDRNGIWLSALANDGCEASISSMVIGGPLVNTANRIQGNGADGIRITNAPGFGSYISNVTILLNSIYSNGGLAINLSRDSDNDGTPDLEVNANDNNDLDLSNSFANRYVNYPIIKSTAYSGDQVEVTYDYNANPRDPDSNPPVGYRLDFYLTDTVDESGHGEAKYYLGSFIVDGDETAAKHTFTSASVTPSSSLYVTATSTVLHEEEEIVIMRHQPSLLDRILSPFTSTARAAEITPQSYQFGSTSEFSPVAVLTPGVVTGGGLSATGDNQLLLLGAGLLLVASAVRFQRRRHISANY